ncbi:hypothetical protein RhiLY_10490 [Ceratobasidium sp. AG-Ba]|nr:hypothetical protein RhiLY_10490 [Ceratobasidium sp. AG-Ba]
MLLAVEGFNLGITQDSSSQLDYNVDDDECNISSLEIVFESTYIPLAGSTSLINSTLDGPTAFDSSPRLVQSQLPFKPISRAEWDAQDSRRFHERQEEREKLVEQVKTAAEKKKLARHKQDRGQKCVEHAQKKALREQLLPKSMTHTPSSISEDEALIARQNIALRSRPYIATYRSDRNAEDSARITNSGALKRQVNWTHPLIWSQIECAALSVGYPWSPIKLVHRLQLLNPTMFALLRPQRISQWRDHGFTNILRWTHSHIQSIKAGDCPNRIGTDRIGVLQGHPDVVRSIMQRLTDLRKAGVALISKTGFCMKELQRSFKTLKTLKTPITSPPFS